jgi:hypothetical protein
MNWVVKVSIFKLLHFIASLEKTFTGTASIVNFSKANPIFSQHIELLILSKTGLVSYEQFINGNINVRSLIYNLLFILN